MLDLERQFRGDLVSRITTDIKAVTARDPGRSADYLSETAYNGVWNRAEGQWQRLGLVPSFCLHFSYFPDLCRVLTSGMKESSSADHEDDHQHRRAGTRTSD